MLFTQHVHETEKKMENLENNFYETVQEASEAAKKLGIKNIGEYAKRHKEDPRLPPNPYRFYPKIFSFTEFLDTARYNEWNRNFYSTWEEASKAVQKLGIQNYGDYTRLYKKDRRLPSNPYERYPNFPGHAKFYLTGDKRKKNFYPTWQEAFTAAKKLKINNYDDYRRKYKQDERLPSNLFWKYPNFPGWRKLIAK